MRSLFIAICFFHTIIISLFFSYAVASPNAIESTQRLNVLNNAIMFHINHAQDTERKTFFSEIDTNGNVLSLRIYTVALSRLIYSLSYASQYDPLYLQHAKNATDFLVNNLIKEDKLGPYFLSFDDKNEVDSNDNLDIWQQSYGLNGLVELYRVTKNPELLTKIHTLHNAFVLRFRDTKHGGFFNNYSIKNGQLTGSKSIQSLIYPISAYMANLWEADISNRARYQNIIKEHLEIAVEKPIWNSQTGWINANFDRQWNVCGQTNPTELCFSVSPGHNFQFSWLLMRTKNWPFINTIAQEKYVNLGERIADITLNKPIWDKSVIGGFYQEVDPQTNKILSYSKSWWQHSEAIIALTFLPSSKQATLKNIEHFFVRYFVDFKEGGEYPSIDKNNDPIPTDPKGSKGKSSYHTVEAIRFLIENAKDVK